MIFDDIYCLSDCANTGCARRVTAEFKYSAELMKLNIEIKDLSKTCSGYIPPDKKNDNKK